MIYVRRSAAVVLLFILLLVLSAFILLAFRNEKFDVFAIAFGAGVCILYLALYNVAKTIFRHIDRYVLIICIFLTGIGFIMQYRLDPEYAYKQLIMFGIGIVVMFAAIFIVKRADNFGNWNYIFMAGVLGLLLISLVFARVIGGARNWIQIAGLSMQPSEFAKVLFIVAAAYFLSEKNRIVSILPFLGFSAVCILVLVLSTDLGAAILFALTTLVMFFAGTGKALFTLLGAGLLSAGAYVSYLLFPHVRTRVDIWQNPWAAERTQGYQIVQALMAIASGSLFGMGLGLGSPSSIPASNTDFIFAGLCEEFGIIAGVAVILFYLVFIIRGAVISLNARTRFHQLLVFGCTALLCLQCFVIIGGVIKMIPLTGITLPFISYGGSSMVSCMALVGIIEGVAVKNGEHDERKIESIGGAVL